MRHIFRILLFTFLLLNGNFAVAQWDKMAGVIAPYTQTATVSVSSISGTGPATNILDQNDNTVWYSANPLPSNYAGRADQNLFLNKATSFASSTGTVASFANITDNNFNNSLIIPLQNGKSMLRMNIPTPDTLLATTIKLSVGTGGSAAVSIYAFESATDSTLIGTYLTTNNFTIQRYLFPAGKIITHLKLYSTGVTFSLFEIACITELPKEFAVVDLGSVKSVGYIETRHWVSNFKSVSTKLYYSTDNVTWTFIKSLNPNALPRIATELLAPVMARYIKLEHTLVFEDFAKASIWEMVIYDENGWMGVMPAAVSGTQKIAAAMGVNGIWGWGTSAYSTAANNQKGPWLFQRNSTQARNYHNWNWDVTDPDNTPNYATMAAGGGTQAQWWLNWNTEYGAWKNAGLTTEASIQFTSTNFPTSVWNTPYSSAYNYGFAFANHFGPVIGNNNVKTIEVGNEPWMYDSTFYRNILRGMAIGAKTANPNMEVFPCALQSAFPQNEASTSSKNFTGARITAQEAPYLDGLNTHLYCFLNDSNGVRRSVYPEKKFSQFWTILADIRFRNANMPNKKIYVTEFGWDSDGGGDNCTHNECVSEKEQAIYGVRAAMILMRLGIERFHWYFYGNTATGTLFARSGMHSNSFALKKSFTAFEAMKNLIGDRYFLGVEREDNGAYIYKLGDSTGILSHLVAWQPTSGAVNTSNSVTVNVPVAPLATWQLEGTSPYGEAVALPVYASGAITFDVTPIPKIIKLNQGGGFMPCTLTADFTPAQGICETINYAPIVNSNAGNLYYSWTFGAHPALDGNTNPSPSILYPTANTFQTCMYVVGKNGTSICNQQSICKNVNVLSDCNFTPSFTYSNTTCGDVIFNANVTGSTCNVNQWTFSWNFGHGGNDFTGSGSNVTHVFPSNGTYNVSLTVDKLGCPPKTISQNINASPTNTCNCDVTISQGGIYRPSSMGTGAFYLNVQPGQTICVQGTGTYGMLRFINFNGTAAAPIRIKNINGQVKIAHNTYYAALDFQNCRYIHLMGNGDNSVNYGFRVDSCGTASAISIGAKSSDIELHHVEVAKAGFAGIMAKTDPACSDASTHYNNYVMYNLNLHHNYIHDVGGEGFYVGSSFYSGYTTTCSGVSDTLYPHTIFGLDIHHNIVERSDAEGLQYACAPNAQVHDNSLNYTGLDPFAAFQNNGLQCGGGAGGNCYNNKIRNATAAGLIIIGAFGGNKFYNNLIAHSNGIFCDNRLGSIANTTLDIFNNTMVDIRSTAMTFYNEINTNTVKNNVIIRPVNGTFFGYLQGATTSLINNYTSMSMASANFADTLNDNFRPTANSPFVDSGATLSLPFDADYNARTQGAAVDAGAYEFTPIPLALEYLDFQGEREENANLLTWNLLEEKPISAFEMQKSIDEITFIPLAKIVYKSGEKSYFYKDKNVSSPLNYYRLKITDANGNEDFSNVVLLYGEKSFCEIFPNPTSGMISFVTNDRQRHFEVCNELGQVLLQGEAIPESVNLAALPQGVYYVRVGAERVKVVKW